MRIVLFYHSLISDWNHGNAHFLRGIVTELLARGHEVAVYEPRDAWSLRNLVAEQGVEPVARFHEAFPDLDSTRYDPAALDVSEALDGTDLVLVHEWNDPQLVARIGRHRASDPRCRVLFHDTHHRAVTAPAELRRHDLRDYDGVLAFGTVIRDLYISNGWAQRAWTWHEAADLRVFHPRSAIVPDRDLVWIGNWGDEERSAELREFLLAPAAALGLSGTVHGVRYPADALRALAASGFEYRGWVPNHQVPDVLARHRVTVHVPRRPYVDALPGIPTIRMFEALACGVPLVSAPWHDVEGLFTAGTDYLLARDGAEMKRLLRDVLADATLARSLAESGRRTIAQRHTCAHRATELLAIAQALGVGERSRMLAS